MFLRLLGGDAQHLDGPLLLVVGRPGPGEDAERGVIRPGHVRAAHRRGHGNRPLVVLDGFLAHGGVGADRVVIGAAAGDGGRGQAEFLQLLADLLEMGLVALEERDFHAVVAGFLQAGQKREVLGGDVRAPEQQVHSEFHGRSLAANGSG